MIPILVESLISFKCNCRHHNFLVRCTSTTSDQPRTFKCAQARCKTCPFIKNVEEIKQSIKITDHFTCTTVISYDCITCTLCKKLYDSETGRQLSDQFWEDLRDIKKDDKNVSKPVARNFYLSSHSKQHMTVCNLSLHQGSMESHKTQNKHLFFKSGLLILYISTNAFHSTNLFTLPIACIHVAPSF